jgi:hypothetical protein
MLLLAAGGGLIARDELEQRLVALGPAAMLQGGGEVVGSVADRAAFLLAGGPAARGAAGQ